MFPVNNVNIRNNTHLICILFLLAGQMALAQKTSPVYFTKDLSGRGVLKVYQKIKDQVKGKVAVKVHFGEEGNKKLPQARTVKTLGGTFKGHLCGDQRAVFRTAPENRIAS